MLSLQDLSFERFPRRCWNVRFVEIPVSSSSRATIRGISAREGEDAIAPCVKRSGAALRFYGPEILRHYVCKKRLPYIELKALEMAHSTIQSTTKSIR